ncbi:MULTISPECIES: PQQ-binding-like beta-propeller repeat protein [unclassified Streptomyces]|uniref:outer membrane protein assembly factor BamB family protein n=1 Tax=unclassified Streptomyces TaxID=2593676 RepID=UPI0015E19081|nr:MULTISPECIES: PQQ-binding-like beta-propeller repeat protein [unclassified Streptomyces]
MRERNGRLGRRTLLGVLGAAAVAAATGCGRGDSGTDGGSDGSGGADSVPPGDPGEVLWRYRTGAASRGGAAVANGLVHCGYGETTCALRLTDGELEWKTVSGPSMSRPATDDGTLYVTGSGTGNGGLTAMDAADGAERWTYSIPDHAVFAAPRVHDGTVYLGGLDAQVHALNAASGDLRWTAPAGGQIFGGVAVADGTLYVGGGEVLHALDLTDGSERWRFTAAGRFTEPTVAGDLVLAGSTDDTRLYAVDAATGDERWSVRMPGGPASVTASDGTVHASSRGGTLLGLDPATGEERWRAVAARDNSPVAAADGTVWHAAPGDRVQALDAATGEELWQYDAGATVFHLTVTDGALIVGTADSPAIALAR